jgi:endoglucanase
MCETVRAARWRGAAGKGALVIAACSAGACSARDAEVGADWSPSLDASFGDSSRPGDAPLDGRGSNESGAGRCDRGGALRLYYRNLSATVMNTNINYIVKVENATGAPIPLASLEVRYYFTNELGAAGVTDIFYTDTCCSNKITDFKDAIVTSLEATPTSPTATAYMSIGFAPSIGALAVDDAVQVELSYHASGYTTSFSQANDYSFNTSAVGPQTQWNDCPGPSCEAKFTSCALTVHRDGALVWGTPP